MREFLIVVIMLICTAGPAAVIAIVGHSAIKALGRNPFAAPRILVTMIIAFIFAEAIAIIALLVGFNLFK
jgi:F0F1-type ATP synthase membrane subunit c/vacuolar-type H+-ATPase subunit K